MNLNDFDHAAVARTDIHIVVHEFLPEEDPSGRFLATVTHPPSGKELVCHGHGPVFEMAVRKAIDCFLECRAGHPKEEMPVSWSLTVEHGLAYHEVSPARTLSCASHGCWHCQEVLGLRRGETWDGSPDDDVAGFLQPISEWANTLPSKALR